MKITIENIGNFENAEIELNGITVVTGHNSTGKSTIAKSLYALFSGYKDIDKKVEDKLSSDISNLLERLEWEIRRFVKPSHSIIFMIQFVGKIAKRILEYRFEVDKNKIKDVIINYFIEENLELANAFELDVSIIREKIEEILEREDIQENIDKINELLNIDDDIIKRQCINSSVKVTFRGDVGGNAFVDNKQEILLNIKDKSISWNSDKNYNCDNEIKISSNIYFIDNPFLIDESFEFGDTIETLTYGDYSYKQYLQKTLVKKVNSSDIGILEQEKIEKFQKMFDDVIGGRVDFEKGKMFSNNGRNSEVSFYNLATGIKSFLIIKKLINDAKLKDKDVLILDEPEVHLHPDWQLKYAELVVLLQKEFDLTILLNTHSPYFVEAISTYSKKHTIDEKCKFYQTSLKDNRFIIQDKTDSMNEIYNQMAEALRKLERLRLEES